MTDFPRAAARVARGPSGVALAAAGPLVSCYDPLVARFPLASDSSPLFEDCRGYICIRNTNAEYGAAARNN